MAVAGSSMQVPADEEESSSSEGGEEGIPSDSLPEEADARADQRQFQFVIMNENQIYRRRKYVKRKNPDAREVDTKSSEKRISRNEGVVINSQFLDKRKNTGPGIRGMGYNIFWNVPVRLNPASKSSLSLVAQEGVKCPVLRKWFARGINDDCVIHCLILDAVAFSSMRYSPESNYHPIILPFKIRAIQATNELLQDETRNTSDLALIAVSTLSAFERKAGDANAVMHHAKGFESIMEKRKAQYGQIDDCCPLLMKGVNATIAIARLLGTFHESNLLPIDDGASNEVHTDHLLKRLRTSIFSITPLAAAIKCDSNKSFNDILSKTEIMLTQVQNRTVAVSKRFEFSECSDMLDDLWVSQGAFARATGEDPMAPGLARAAWVGITGTLLWITKIGLNRVPDELSDTKKTMFDWISHPSVRQLTVFPTSLVREWAELACKLVHLGF